jgi:hypothetical protein
MTHDVGAIIIFDARHPAAWTLSHTSFDDSGLKSRFVRGQLPALQVIQEGAIVPLQCGLISLVIAAKVDLSAHSEAMHTCGAQTSGVLTPEEVHPIAVFRANLEVRAERTPRHLLVLANLFHRHVRQVVVVLIGSQLHFKRLCDQASFALGTLQRNLIVGVTQHNILK